MTLPIENLLQTLSDGPTTAACAVDPSMRSRRSFRLMAVLLGLLAGAAIAEVAVRAVGWQPPRFVTKTQLFDRAANPPLYYHCYPSNPHGEFAPLPDVSRGDWSLTDYTFEATPLPLSRLGRTPWCVEYRHSSKGIRDREYDSWQAGDQPRLAVVGDSFVFGEGVPEPLCLPRQLEQRLDGATICINGGQLGANIEQEQPIIDALVREAGCRQVIWVVIPNDVPLTPSLARRQKYINDFVLIRDRYLERDRDRRWYSGRLRLADVLLSPFETRQIRRDTTEWYLACYDTAQNAENLTLMQSLFAAAAQRTDARVVLVVYPLLEQLESEYPLQPVHAAIVSMAERAGLPALDLLPVFAGRSSSSLWVHDSDHHPNGSAHALAAEAVVTWLRRDVPGFLPGDGP